MSTLGAIAYLASLFGILLLLIFFVLWLTASLVSSFSGIPYVGSHKRKIREMLALVKPKKGARFYDVGSGDGRIVFLASQEFGLNSIGIEFNPILVAYCRVMAFLFRMKNARFIRGDVLKYNYGDADIIYVFMFPFLVEALAPKLLAECKKGTIIISHGFEIHPLKKILYKTIKEKPFSTYFYKI